MIAQLNKAKHIADGQRLSTVFANRVYAIAKLAGPVSAARLGMLTLVMVDTAMIGHFSTSELAFYSLAHASHMVCTLIGVGMLIGTAVLTAQAAGASAHKECGVIWRVSILHAFVLGCVFASLGLAGFWLYTQMGFESTLANGAGDVLLVLNLGLPGQLVYTASTLFLEALNRPGPGLAIMVAANFVNIGLNWILIHGEITLGAEGAAWATTITRWIIAGVAVIYILNMKDAHKFNIAGRLGAWKNTGYKLRRLGYPLGLAQGLESTAFASLTIFAGHISIQAAGAFQIVMTVVAFCFMAAIGVGTATAVHVATAIGRRDQRQIILSGWAGLFTIAMFMTIMAVLINIFPMTLAGVFTNDPLLLAIIVPTLLVGSLILVCDGAQGVLMGALRGAGDVWTPTALHLFAFLFVMVPAAGWLSLRTSLGTPGLMWGTLSGVTLAAILLAWRFHCIAKQPINRL